MQMTHRLWCLLFPCDCKELCLPALVSAVALLPYRVSIVIQQYPETAYIMAHHAVVKGQTEAALLGPVTEQQLQLGHILLLPEEPTHGHVVLGT